MHAVDVRRSHAERAVRARDKLDVNNDGLSTQGCRTFGFPKPARITYGFSGSSTTRMGVQAAFQGPAVARLYQPDEHLPFYGGRNLLQGDCR